MQHSGEQFIIIHGKKSLWNLTETKKVQVKNSGTVVQFGEVKEICIQISNALVETPKSEAVPQKCFHEKVFWENVASLQESKLFAFLLKSHFHMGVLL